ncbi:MAG: peptidoglycan-binding protein [Clostridia bacterium]|nr:peptidoglycan-binding protein [Clostridia bacterium]
MDLMKTVLLYMSLALTSAVGDAPMPTPTPTPVATPAPIVTPAPAQAADPVEEVIQEATKAPAPTVKPTAKPTAQPDLEEAPEMTPNPKYKLLKNGSRGDDVRKLQQRLKELGYLQAEVDGVYGDRTKGAVMRFQKAHGLSRDGVAGKHTQTILYEYDQVIADPSAVTPSPVPTQVPTPEPTLEPTAEPTLTPTQVPTAEPTQIPVLQAETLPVAGTPVPPLTQILPQGTALPTQPPEESTEAAPQLPDNMSALAVLADGKVTVDGMEVEAANLLALSAELDVLVDVEGLAEALEWDPDPVMEGLGWEIELGDYNLSIAYSLYEEALDLVSVTCNGEDVELTEAMTGLYDGRLFLAPVWLEAVGTSVQWDAQNLTLKITFE